MEGEVAIAAGGAPACCGSEGVCIRVINCFSVSPGPPSLWAEFVFWGSVTHPKPDARRRRAVSKVRCKFLKIIKYLQVQ
jgi:hypothetical protein